jgi:prepilin-type N-terminal cleavage/methylation domain-containing protein/prepilin-type processing-associated H-X9-DG protein
MRTHQQKKAFTLIELLVVIAIIAILAAILFPVFAQAREKARAITCVSNEKQLALGILMYVQDYDETLPYYAYFIIPGGATVGPSDPPFAPSVGERTVGWNEAVYPYVKNIKIYRCPDTTYLNGGEAANPGGGSPFANLDDSPFGQTTYSINARISGNTGPLDDGPWATHPPTADGALEFAASTILLSEANDYGSDGTSSSDENEWGWEGRHVDKLYGDGWDYGTDPGATYLTNGRPVLQRHTGGANYAFADGHVKFLSAGYMGLMANPSYPATETAAEVVADPTGQHATYCPNANCAYNVPATP